MQHVLSHLAKLSGAPGLIQVCTQHVKPNLENIFINLDVVCIGVIVPLGEYDEEYVMRAGAKMYVCIRS